MRRPDMLKVVLVGSSGVGKTSLLNRYYNGEFKDDVSATIGTALLSIEQKVDNVVFKIQVWDTAGQERFRALSQLFYRNAEAAVIVYSVTERKSFNEVKFWIEELTTNVGDDLILCIVGNKCDLESVRQVAYNEGRNLAERKGAIFYEVSAWSGSGVDEVFSHLAANLCSKVRNRDDGQNRGFYLSVFDAAKSWKCYC